MKSFRENAGGFFRYTSASGPDGWGRAVRKTPTFGGGGSWPPPMAYTGREEERRMEKKNPVGRPPKYKSAAEMERLIDEYFESCRGKPYLDADGYAVTDKHGAPIMIGEAPPTITGLALALGFRSRMALLTYQGKKEFTDVITRAKSRVEEYAERRLFDRDGANGAKFSLSNNFEGWKEKKEINADVKDTVNITIGLVDEDDDE